MDESTGNGVRRDSDLAHEIVQPIQDAIAGFWKSIEDWGHTRPMPGPLEIPAELTGGVLEVSRAIGTAMIGLCNRVADLEQRVAALSGGEGLEPPAG